MSTGNTENQTDRQTDRQEVIKKIADHIVEQIARVNEMMYQWYRDRTAPYYLPPIREEDQQPKEVDRSKEDV